MHVIAFAALVGMGFFAGGWTRSELDGEDGPVSSAANSATKIAFAVLVLWLFYKHMAKKGKG